MKDRMGQFQQLLQVQGQGEDDQMFANEMIEYESKFYNNALEEDTEKFLLKAEVLQNRLKACQQLIDEMKKKQSEVLTQTHTDDRLEEDLDCLIKRIKDQTTSINQEMKVLEDAAKEDETWSAERRMKQSQVVVLQRIFQDVMYGYNTAQMEHKEKCKKRIIRQLEISGSSKSEDEIEEMLENKDLTVFTTEILLDSQKTKMDLKLIESRHCDIIRLEKSLYELQDLFLEIAKTVESQFVVPFLRDRKGYLLDNIQHNVELTEEYISSTTAALKIAKRYKRRRLFFCCPCLHLCSIL